MKTNERDSILKVMGEIENDGHTVYEAGLLKGLPETLTKGLVKKQGTNAHGDPKAMVFAPNGERIYPVGFHGLSLLWRIAAYIKADTSEANTMLGRGSQARAVTKAIYVKLG